MERILRSEKVAVEEVFEQAFSFSNPVVYYPVRHHSVACSYHLQKVMERYEPDCILIEGPEGANELLPIMADAESEAPFAVYYSYQDSKGYVSKEKNAYKCYYPFLDYSPELVAVRYGTGKGIHTAFFDLPYAEILIACEENKGLRKKTDKNNYNDDYYLAKNAFFQWLVERTGVRNFDEFWEKYFELNGLQMATEEFVKNLLHYCVLSRMHSSKTELQEEGCLAREAYMRANIAQAQKKYKRILVVTGGFHTYGLLQADAQEKYPLHNIEKEAQGVYLMSYSMEAADSLNGYASGMPFPNFYQQIYEQMQKEAACQKAYQDTVLRLLVKVGKEVRKKDGYLSTYDEICAYRMAQNLAGLRGKPYPGAYELWDSVLSSYIKGEYNQATKRPMEILAKNLTGRQIGKVCKNAIVPPLVQDFEATGRSYRLKIGSSIKTEVTLSIFSTKRHRDISKFFYRMCFLDTAFAIRQKGPDIRLKKDRNLIREIWSYKWSSQVISALIDASVYGGTLEEACTSLAFAKLKEELDAETATDLLIQMFEMGLAEQVTASIARIKQFIRKEEDFFSLVKAFSNILMLEELSSLYQSEMEMEPLLRVVYHKVMQALAHMAAVKEENLEETMEAVKTLNSLLGRKEYEADLDSYLDILQELLADEDLHPGLEGAIWGILYGRGLMRAEEAGRVCAGYMAGTQEKKRKIAFWLQGLFYTARDIVFAEKQFIEIIDGFVSSVEDAEFMQLLPQFRLAFSYFAPAEIDKLAEQVANRYHTDKAAFLKMKNVTPEMYQYGRYLEEQVLGVMGK